MWRVTLSKWDGYTGVRTTTVLNEVTPLFGSTAVLPQTELYNNSGMYRKNGKVDFSKFINIEPDPQTSNRPIFLKYDNNGFDREFKLPPPISGIIFPTAKIGRREPFVPEQHL